MKRFYFGLLCVFLSAYTVVVAKDLPSLYNPSPTFEEKGYEWVRNVDIDDAKYYYARGGTIGFSEIKNILRFFFVDTGRAFTEIDFFADQMKLKVSETSKEKNKKILKFSNGGEVKVSLNKKKRLSFSGKFEAQEMKMRFILPYTFFADSTIDVDGKSVLVSADSKDGSTQIFENVKKIIFSAESKESAFSIMTKDKPKLLLRAQKSRYEVELTFASEFSFRLDTGSVRIAKTPPVPFDAVHKIGDINFWAEERMILPDTREKNLMQNSSFEMGFQYLSFRHFLSPLQNEELWKIKPVKICDNTALYGRKCLSIFSDSNEKALRQQISTASVAIEKGDYVFSVWAKTDAKKQSLTLMLANPHKLYNKSEWIAKKVDLTNEWRRYELTFSLATAQVVPFVFLAESDSPATCYIDAMQLERGKIATDYEPPCAEGMLITSSPENFIEYGKKVDAKLEISTIANGEGSVEIDVEDFFGENIFSKNESFKADSSGVATIPLDFEKFDRGIFLLKTKYKQGDREHYNIQRFTIADFLKNEHKHKNLFVDTYVDPLSTQQFFPELLARYKALGYGARAGYMNNDKLIAETAQKYGVDSLITYIGRIQRTPKNKHGREMLFLSNVNWFSFPNLTKKKATMLDYWQNLPEKEITPKYLEKVEAVAEQKARENPWIKIWGGFGEPEGSMTYFANPDFAKREDFLMYIEIECAIARGVRKGNPNAILSTSVTSTLARKDRLNYFDNLLGETAKRGVKYDAIGAHIYRGAPEYPRPTLEENYQSLFEILKKHGYENAPIYSPEGLHWLPIHCYDVCFIDDYSRRKNALFGVLPYTYDIGHGERLATALRARTWLLGLKHERIKCMNASNYGVSQMDAMLTPFAYDKVPNTLGVLLGNSTFEEELNLFPDTRCYIFKDEKNRPVVAIWACKKEFDRGFQKAPELSFKPIKNLRLFDLMQSEKKIETDFNGNFNLPLSIFPVFLVGEEGTMDDVKAMLKLSKGKSNIPINPIVRTRIESINSNIVEVENPYVSTMSGEVAVRADSKKFDIQAGKVSKFSFSSFEKITSDGISSIPLKLSLNVDSPEKKSMSFDKSYRAYQAKLASINLDGDISDWSGVPSIKLDNMRRASKLWKKGITPTKDDFSAEYKTAWKDNNLYVAVIVRDSTILTGKGGAVDNDSKCDSVEFIFDTLCDASDDSSTIGLNSNDWHYRIWKSKDGTIKVYRQFVPDAQLTLGILGAKQHTLANDVDAVFKKIDGGYVFEICFKGTSMLPFKPTQNASLGFGVIVNDFDDSQSPEAKARLTNSTSTDKLEVYPDKFPFVILGN